MRLRAMRVLMVEDDVKMAGLVRRGMAEDGHAADVASTGEDAVWMAQAHPYDAIVLDVMLPGSRASRPASGCAMRACGRQSSCLRRATGWTTGSPASTRAPTTI